MGNVLTRLFSRGTKELVVSLGHDRGLGTKGVHQDRGQACGELGLLFFGETRKVDKAHKVSILWGLH